MKSLPLKVIYPMFHIEEQNFKNFIICIQDSLFSDDELMDFVHSATLIKLGFAMDIY